MLTQCLRLHKIYGIFERLLPQRSRQAGASVCIEVCLTEGAVGGKVSQEPRFESSQMEPRTIVPARVKASYGLTYAARMPF